MNRKNIFPIIVICLIVGPTCVALSIHSDYYEAWANTNVRNAANILIDGHNIGNFGKFGTNEALTQLYFIEGMKTQYDIAVLGNSRVMQIYALNFPNMSLVSHAISGGNIEDTIAYTQIYIEKEQLPKVVIVGIDPETIHNGQPRSELEERYMQGMKQLNLPGFTIVSSEENGVDIFQKLSYIRQGLKIPNIRALLGMKPSYYPTDEREEGTITKLIDGWAYPLGHEQQRDERVKNRELHSYGIPESFQPENAKKIESYLQRLYELNVTPILFCAPYHPTVYSGFMNITAYMSTLTEITTYLHELSDENKIVLIGAYDPSVYNLTGADFYDGYHPKPQAIARIISAHSRELYDLLYADMYPTYESYTIALAESQAELFT